MTTQTRKQYRITTTLDGIRYAHTVEADNEQEAREMVRQQACGPCRIEQIERYVYDACKRTFVKV